jgi:hypothetical protein
MMPPDAYWTRRTNTIKQYSYIQRNTAKRNKAGGRSDQGADVGVKLTAVSTGDVVVVFVVWLVSE